MPQGKLVDNISITFSVSLGASLVFHRVKLQTVQKVWIHKKFRNTFLPMSTCNWQGIYVKCLNYRLSQAVFFERKNSSTTFSPPCEENFQVEKKKVI